MSCQTLVFLSKIVFFMLSLQFEQFNSSLILYIKYLRAKKSFILFTTSCNAQRCPG